MSDEKDVEKIVMPWWPGPDENEEDSPGYYEFWGPAMRAVDIQVEQARKAGRKIMLLTPGETTSTNITS